MRKIDYNEIVETVRQLCIDACYDLPADVLDAIKKAQENETNPRARRILDQIAENARIARKERIPLCQDTGLCIVFLEMGKDVAVTAPEQYSGATVIDAIQQGVRLGYDKGLLRKSVVSEPLNKRQNTQTNTPAIIHTSIVTGDRLNITVMAKGGGCENKSRFKMFNPTQDAQTVSGWITDVVRKAGANACPPFVVGVGMGGDFEVCCMLSKKALLRKIGTYNSDPFYADMEKKLLREINNTQIGPQGLGGDTTALAVSIETAPCHIASLPVAVNIECHSHRHKSAAI